MQKKCAGHILKYIRLSVCLFVLFIGLKYVSTFAPDEQVKSNVRDSIQYMYHEEGVYPRFYIKEENFYSQRLDNYSDGILLNVCYNMDKNSKITAIAGDFRGSGQGENALERAYHMIAADEYGIGESARHWYGQAAVLRILLSVFNYQEIRVICQFVFLVLMGIVLLLSAKRVGIGMAIIFFISFAAINPASTAACVNLGAAFFVLLLGMIWVCLQYGRKRNAVEICYVVGACTAYFDLFSVPFVTFAVVVMMLSIDLTERQKTDFLTLFVKTVQSGVAWVSGYLILWMSKWAFASVVLRKNIFLNAWNEMKIQSVEKAVDWGPDTAAGMIVEALRSNFCNMFPVNVIGLVYQRIFAWGGVLSILIVLLFFVAAVWVILKKISYQFCNVSVAAVFLAIACIPYICYIVMHTHAFIHFWMWYRLQYITFVSIAAAFYFGNEKCRGGNNDG
ncbi:MAG: hypothetical protein HFH34_10470 [Eubacterium sp.]|nr:hypothetical protein [Eubacterium sp.]